ncbi:MAG: metalloregulator ArsR/SmtB family transcription factor [Candidatus Eisenbacteria bacterium]|uniref:Winged helix-turn-helix transcriptional regulator n=1 Tax=Eiseniibacteriota bacterium TaxID=2212470 RepID=A0A956LVK7_UNCEI|nr:winged helix-turn-helix transcriptional regulator [Candidatus Eisenbacteria bacterium]
MTLQHPSPSTLDRIAQRFRLLGDPVRLRLLHALADGERSVGDLVEAAETGQANVSKHLALMLREGLVERRKQGLQVFYKVADPEVFALCGLVCGSLEGRLSVELSAILADRQPKPTGTTETAISADAEVEEPGNVFPSAPPGASTEESGDDSLPERRAERNPPKRSRTK